MSYEALSPQHKSRRILVVDHEPQSLDLLLEPLRWGGFDARGVTSSEIALHLAATWKPHVVLLEWIPSVDISGFLRKLKSYVPHASVLFVSSNSSTESIIAGLDAGADDYVVKPFVPLELLARIRTQIRIRDLHEQLASANEKLQELVDIDDLTGLYNMRSVYQRLELEMDRARRFGRQVAVVMMDMDYFKTVNDGHDHLFGSFVLSEVGKIIKANVRNIDIPARYGGDEFLIVLSETSKEGVLQFCERLRESVAKTTFINGADSIKLTVSLGFSVTQLGEAISPRELVRRADHALYDSKRTGRNRVSLYQGEDVASGTNVVPLKNPGSLTAASFGQTPKNGKKVAG